MGQSNSTTAQQSSLSSGSANNDFDLDDDNKPMSGISLSPELEGSIVRDFQNQTLQEEWDEFRKSVLKHRRERSKSLNETYDLVKQQHEVRMKLFQQRHTMLDQTIDELNASLTDGIIALQYDASNLLNQLSHQQKQGDATSTTTKSISLSCLGQRAHWIDCQKKYGVDPRPCNAYIDALEKCVNSTIGDTVTRKA